MEKEEKVDCHDIIVKFLSEEISDKEMSWLKSWLDEDPANRLIFDEENELWRELSFNTKSEQFKPETAWIKISSKLGLGKIHGSNVTVVSRNNYRLLIAAASVACILAIGGMSLYIDLKSSLKNIPALETIVATNEGEKSHVYLSDGTSVFLNSGSTLKYNGRYNNEDRIVNLTGEAYFDVQTNPEKPFIVKTGQVTVIATGTKFNVLSYNNENRVETTLEEGHLQVSVKEKEPVSINAGQQVAYFKNSDEVIVRDAPADTYTSWKENKLRFDNTPFMEAMRGISRRYNVKIDITNKALLDITYSATFIDEPIEDVMSMLKQVSPIPITYKIYNQTSVNDTIYTKPKIVVGLGKR
jgi:transmembrane sensor